MIRFLIFTFCVLSSSFASFQRRAQSIPNISSLSEKPFLPNFLLLKSPFLPLNVPNLASQQSLDNQSDSPFKQIQTHLNAQKANIGLYLNITDPSSTTLCSLYPKLNGIGGNQLSKCYNPKLGNEEFDIFKNSIFDVITAYYKEYPENFDMSRLREKSTNLFKSMRAIAEHTLTCLDAPNGFQLGLTQFSDSKGIGGSSMRMGAMSIDSSALAKFLNRRKNIVQLSEEELDEEDEDDEDNEVTKNTILDSRWGIPHGVIIKLKIVRY